MKHKYMIIPTHSNYVDVCNLFLYLLKKNWNTCDYEIIISITGENIEFNGYTTLYNGENATLPTCILNATERYESDYYLCFLGDVFINDRFDEDIFNKIIHSIRVNNFEYCSLYPMKIYKRERSFNHYCRYINTSDRYNINFVCFYASRKFIKNNFSKDISDLDFELKYLQEGNNRPNVYFDNKIIVKNNYFNFVLGIDKGKWNRKAYKKIKAKNPEVVLDFRKLTSRTENCVYFFVSHFINHIPSFLRISLKKIIQKVFGYEFTTMT